MIVNINNSTYEMNSKQYKGVLKTASKAVDRGIYAVEKNKVAIMLNERYGDDMSLRKNVDQYVKKRFKVYWKNYKKCNIYTNFPDYIYYMWVCYTKNIDKRIWFRIICTYNINIAVSFIYYTIRIWRWTCCKIDFV